MKRHVVPVIIGFAWLAGCASPARVDLRERMVGMSESQLAGCMGEPARKENIGRTKLWTYYTPDLSNARPLDASLIPRHHQAVVDMGGNACLITVKLESSRVMAVDYANMASTREDAECAASIQRCGAAAATKIN